MPAPGIAMIVAVALIVAALAVALTWIVLLLLRISKVLGTADAHLGAIPGMLGPLGPVVERINSSLVKIRE